MVSADKRACDRVAIDRPTTRQRTRSLRRQPAARRRRERRPAGSACHARASRETTRLQSTGSA